MLPTYCRCEKHRQSTAAYKQLQSQLQASLDMCCVARPRCPGHQPQAVQCPYVGHAHRATGHSHHCLNCSTGG
jgi:hypothetical protein